MARRKLTLLEKIQKRIKKFESILDAILKSAEKYVKEGSTTKLRDSMISAGTALDQIKKLITEIQAAPEEDLALEFSEKTVKEFYKWLKEHDIDYSNYLKLRKEAPDLFKRLMNEFKPKPEESAPESESQKE